MHTVVHDYETYLNTQWGKSHKIRPVKYTERLSDLSTLKAALGEDDHALKLACEGFFKNEEFLGRNTLIINIRSIMRKLYAGEMQSNLEIEDDLTINAIKNVAVNGYDEAIKEAKDLGKLIEEYRDEVGVLQQGSNRKDEEIRHLRQRNMSSRRKIIGLQDHFTARNDKKNKSVKKLIQLFKDDQEKELQLDELFSIKDKNREIKEKNRNLKKENDSLKDILKEVKKIKDDATNMFVKSENRANKLEGMLKGLLGEFSSLKDKMKEANEEISDLKSKLYKSNKDFSNSDSDLRSNSNSPNLFSTPISHADDEINGDDSDVLRTPFIVLIRPSEV